ncbi:MAG: helix-turn-helix transcriptional regulator [Verrucomicrobiota bacterium]
MHRFRTVLSIFLRENNWTQQHLAGLLDADQATVSRWLSGRVEMGSSTLQRLLSEIPAESRATMLEAYMRDCIPEGFEDLIQFAPNPSAASISAHADTGENEGPESKFPELLDPELKKRLVYFAKMATRSPDVRKLLDVMYRISNKKRA